MQVGLTGDLRAETNLLDNTNIGNLAHKTQAQQNEVESVLLEKCVLLRR